MSTSSKSGLVPTPQRRIPRKKPVKPENLLPTKYVVKPITLTLRPFGGLYNPYAKGCSVLCNHPAPSAVRKYINQLKNNLVTDNKTSSQNRDQLFESETDNIPEDLFRRYTDTDSRPLTPSPTVTSVRTRNSTGSFLNNRRCITPELRKNEISKRKKIILDLRRSHSQETLYWKPTSEISQSALTEADIEEKRVVTEKKVKKQKSDDIRPKTPATIPEEFQEDCKKPPISCINEHDIADDDARRGKKRKKIKPQPATTTFHLSEDPETQVATLGPDSLNPSTRPSLIPNAANLLPSKEKRESEPVLLKGSFLTDEAFEALKTELDVDTIENTFDRYLNRAMREAYKYVPVKAKENKPKPIYECEKLYFETRSKMPRKFSKSATRFDVPLDMKTLEEMSVFEYLSKYVWVSRQRKQLYKKVFLKHLVQVEEPEETEENEGPIQVEYVERKMSAKNITEALTEVLDFYGTEKNIKEILRLIEVKEDQELNFRSWCGIVSFSERLALDDVTGTDSSDELEKADFTSMQKRLDAYDVPEKLKEVFDVIRRGHF
ncbi:uncharacterized protein LOC129919698 [Episyrphus balteatus]|uniref:uncharacterized protein LOC129919698 n=1 Tax=Episyrphus balteatus TaxID=286459 RepID=UPI00248630F0|nr:uncharacterized protein LOC129919698 [Episyrphus balteatus]